MFILHATHSVFWQVYDNMHDRTLLTYFQRSIYPMFSLFLFRHSQSWRDVLLRGRVHGLRVIRKKLIFVQLRQGIHTVQCVLSEGKSTPRAMLNFA